MAFNLIGFGAIISFICNILLGAFLTHYNFDISEQNFTIALLINLFLVNIFVGMISKRNETHAGINGLFVAFCSFVMVLLFLSQYDDMDWLLNIYLGSIWMFIGYFGGITGSKMVRTKRKTNPQLVVEPMTHDAKSPFLGEEPTHEEKNSSYDVTF